jgi:PAS domain S-box-containing protein
MVRMRPEDVGIGRLFDSVRDAVILADAETQQIRLWNAAAADMFGYSTSEALGLRIESLIPSRLKARHREGIARYAATGHGPYVDSHSLLELPALTKSGEEISIELSLSPMRDIPGVDGRRFVLAIIRDVTNRKKVEEDVRRLNEGLENRVLGRTRELQTALAQRKRVERKLREAEARARMVIEQIPAVTYIQELGYPSITTYVSPQTKTLLGYEPEECTSDPDHWTKILHPDDKERVLAEDRRTNETGEPFKMEYRQFAKDGSVVWVKDEAVLMRDDEGNPSYWIGVQIDISERKKTEEELRYNEERFRSLVQNVSDVITILEADGTVRYVSPAIEKVTGYHPEERVGINTFDVVHSDDLERASSIFTEILKTPGEHPPLEFRMLHKDGSWRNLEHVVNNLLHEPIVMGIVVTTRDTTERKRTEDALREARDRFRSVFDHAPIGMARVSLEGRYLQVNRSLCEILGRSEDELLATTWQEITHPDDMAASSAYARRVVEGEIPRYDLDKRFLRADGHTVWTSLSVSLVRGSEGEPLYFVSKIQDATERKKAEEEIKEANRHLEELAVLRADFTAMVAHELDTPLAVIRGYAEMLATDALEPAEQSHAPDKILAEAEVLRGLIADVRDATAFEREDFAVEPQQVSVHALLDTVQCDAALLGNHPLVIENAVDDEQVWADPNRIHQVLRNLLSNAAKYSPDNAPIELRAKPGKTPGCTRIEVTDYGSGIHPDDVQRVFEKFGRGRDRYGRKIAGVGLGLYLSRRIVRAHGSDLTLSSGPKDGTVFGFNLETVR